MQTPGIAMHCLRIDIQNSYELVSNIYGKLELPVFLLSLAMDDGMTRAKTGRDGSCGTQP